MSDPSQKSPLWILLSTLIMTIIGLCWVIWSIYSVNFRDASLQNAWTLEVTSLRGDIILLDEILSSSARLAAETGNKDWENRYRKYESELGQKIERAIELVPEVQNIENISNVDAANIALVEMEEQAFTFIKKGQISKAKELLYSEEYEAQKTIYIAGMISFERSLYNAVTREENQRQQDSQIQILVISGITIILSVAWIMVFHSFKKWQTNIKRANEAKTSFLSTMSHEIRTPLNGILGVTQLLADTKLNKDQKNKIQTIQSSGQTLLAIINDILDMSKIEAGAVELENTIFSLSDFASTTMTAVESLATEKGLKFRLNKSDDCPDYLIGDPVRIRQILWNLISNAIKFTDKGSVTVTLTTETPEEHITPKDTVIRLRVEDTGKGIEPERLQMIFDPFTQEDSTITRTHGGTGLGLSIVRKMVELMGGYIQAESIKNKGSCFDVYLPFEIATAAQQHVFLNQKDPNQMVHHHDLDILVAEDNPVNAMIARAFLEKFGHKVRIAENGKLAIEQIENSIPDMIFMDIHMPEMNGLEATKSIRQLDFGSDIPIVGLTAEAFTERHSQFIEMGMDGVLSKPFTEQELHSAISQYSKAKTKKAS
ncbi:ATP-binding protein [Kiloniella sp. EL199]|uniref:ATP-binding protein n=1 Tax=Kiloniella sp. EL199 TaxID=2107581 RepID=UPI000EA1F903|nr:ATP-binding protein [Kiloniella sp. EL199]